MSLSRNLVDLYILASAVTKVSTCAIASQTSAVCLHVKTSSLMNPTPMNGSYAKQEAAIEVPFPNFVENESIEHTTPLENRAPVDNVAPVESKAPFESKAPIENKAPVEIKAPVENKAPAENKAPVEPKHVAKPVVAPVELPVETITETVKIEAPEPVAENIIKQVEQKRVMKESHIPTSRFGRLWNYGTLATGMGMGAINESLKRATGLSQETSGKQWIF